MTSSKDYWAARERAQQEANKKLDAKFDKELKKIYDTALINIRQEIDAFYGRYATKEGISLAEAKKRVSQADIKAYEAKAKEYVTNRTFTEQANEEMRLYNLTMKVNRLEMLKSRIGMELAAKYSDMERKAAKHLQSGAEDEFKRMAGILGKSVPDVKKAASTIPGASFHNATYSERIWTNQRALKSELDKLLQEGMIQGRNPKALAPQLQRAFGVSKVASERLMRTEMCRVQIEAQRQSYDENGIDEFEYMAHAGCCEICAGMNGKVFKVKKMIVGDNAPPMHPNCRCGTVPHIDMNEYEEWLDSYNQHHMSYSDWIKMHSDSKSGDLFESDFKKFKRGQKFPKEIDGALDKKQYIKIRKEYQKATREKFSHGTELGKRIFVQYADQSAIKTLMETKVVRYQDGKLYLNMYNDLHDPRGAATGYFHEFGHQIDEKLGWKFTKDSTLRDKLKNDFYNISNEEIYEEIKTNYKASSVSDMIGGLSKGKIKGRYGHKQDYWKTKSHITSEFFAHFIEAQFDSERRKILESTFPESYNYVEEMLERGMPK